MTNECNYILTLLKRSETTYKQFLLLYIVKNASYNKMDFSFSELAIGIVIESWIYIEGRSRPFNRVDNLYKLIIDIIADSGESLSVFSDENDIKSFLISNKCSLKKRINHLTDYAPYRLLEDDALRLELTCLKDSKKNKYISDMSNRVTLLYRIENKHIYMQDKYLVAIVSNRELLIEEIEKIIRERFCDDLSR